MSSCYATTSSLLHKATSISCALDLKTSESLKVLTDSVNMEVFIWLGRSNKNVGSSWSSSKVKDMEAIFSGFTFKNPGRSIDLKSTATILAFIGDMMFLAQELEGENISNAVGVDANLICTKISNRRRGYWTFIAMDIDWSGSLTSVVDMLGIWE